MRFSTTFGVLVSATIQLAQAKGPFLQVINETHSIIGNDHWNITQGFTYATKLYYKGQDLIGDAVGHYVSYNGAASDLNWTSPTIVARGQDWIDVSYTAIEGDLHWIIQADLTGAYQYFVNRALPTLGEFRTLFRLDNTSFTHGRTSLKDDILPPLSEYAASTKIQDETWQKADGTYLTKYDWSAFLREEDFYGVYGEDFGSWYIYPGKDEYNGNHLKQELMIHRESATGDTVQLNMLHGTHFQASATDAFPVNKTWGPWLWYLNTGAPTHLKQDAARRAEQEIRAWPYPWFTQSAYTSRGAVSGTLNLTPNRPAAHAAIFLGDRDPTKTSLDMGSNFYYTTHADAHGNFEFNHVRAGEYALQAWSTGGLLADIPGFFQHDNITVTRDRRTELPTLTWTPPSSSRTQIFRVGAFDRKTLGFAHGGAPYTHGLADACPADLTYSIGTSVEEEWCFAQTQNGTWAIVFSATAPPGANDAGAVLTVSLAGYSAGTSAEVYLNGGVIGNLTSGGGSSTNFTHGLANDPGLYRSATTAGEWRHFEFPVDAAALGRVKNRIEFRVERAVRWRGFMWDAVALAWT